MADKGKAIFQPCRRPHLLLPAIVSGPRPPPLLPEDGYNWIMNSDEGTISVEDEQRWSYKCDNSDCQVMKNVSRNLVEPLTEIKYFGRHTHRRPRVDHHSFSHPSGMLIFHITTGTENSTDGDIWEKYNQFPLRGDPTNLRIYYRCSDSNCRARKHVERCGNDVVATYEGEHNHLPPPCEMTWSPINELLQTNSQ